MTMKEIRVTNKEYELVMRAMVVLGGTNKLNDQELEILDNLFDRLEKEHGEYI